MSVGEWPAGRLSGTALGEVTACTAVILPFTSFSWTLDLAAMVIWTPSVPPLGPSSHEGDGHMVSLRVWYPVSGLPPLRGQCQGVAFYRGGMLVLLA